MILSDDLVSQFAKVVVSKDNVRKETTSYGTIVVHDDTEYVKIDGSDLLTPMETTADVKNGDRVLVMIKNHTATVTGNVTSPAARTDDVKEIDEEVEKLKVIVADKVSTKELEAERAEIDDLLADKVSTKELEAERAEIDEVFADKVSTKELEAERAEIDEVLAGKLSATDADLKYANIDFTNIDKATMQYFYAQSGLINDVVVGDGTITGHLVGVTISGDLIEGNTIVAEKLVIKGEDGLYYKLNTNGSVIEEEQTDYNSLNGSVIKAKSITATKIAVNDLVAFDATIGGFHITDSAIYSGVKETVGNATRGIYLDSTGQMAIGDSSNFLKYYKDQNGNYKLEISARSIKMGASGANVEDTINNAVRNVTIEYALSDSSTTAPISGWSLVAPAWSSGKYMWQKTTTTLVSGEVLPSTMTCIQGAKGETGSSGKDGADAVILQIISSNGQMFKNSSVSTTLAVNIIVAGHLIASSREMYEYFGNDAYLVWLEKKLGETTFSAMDASDPRISDNGFLLTIDAGSVSIQTVYNCELYY